MLCNDAAHLSAALLIHEDGWEMHALPCSWLLIQTLWQLIVNFALVCQLEFVQVMLAFDTDEYEILREFSPTFLSCVSGPLPPVYSRLRNLQVMDFSANGLEGEISPAQSQAWVPTG